MEIREFQRKDLDSVIKVNRKCLPENYPKSFFIYIYKSFPEGFKVATVGKIEEEIVGYGMSRIEYGKSNHSRFKLTKKGHIISIAVFPDYRRQGIAQKILKHIMDAMVAKDVSEVYLEVRESNEGAIKLYEKLGYETIKILDKYYADEENAKLMSRTLPFQ